MRKSRVLYIGIDDEYVKQALNSGFYLRKNHYVDFYVRWRINNYIIPVRSDISDEFLREKLELLKNLDFLVNSWYYKKAIGGYTLSLICPKLSGKFYVLANTRKITVRKV